MKHTPPAFLRKFFTGSSLGFLALGLSLGVAGTAMLAGMRGSDRFSDIPAGAYYDAAVGELVDAGILRGNADGTFAPGSFVTRADLAVILKRLRDEVQGIHPTPTVRERPKQPSPPPPPPPSSTPKTTETPARPAANPAGTVRFITGKFTVKENAGPATLAVIRTGGKRGAVTIAYSLSAGTATEGSDYEKVEGTLSFKDGETSKNFTVTIKNDTEAEGTETLTVTLATPGGGASLGVPSTAELTILDDETPAAPPPSSAGAAAAISFSAFSYDMAENRGSVTVTVLRTGVGSVSVSYAASDGTAHAGLDYTATSGTLAFATGETSKTFTVPLFDNTLMGGNKTVNLKLSSPTGGAVLGNPSTALLTLVDNELITFGSGSFKFDSSSYRASEADGASVITVKRVDGADGLCTIQYATSNGSAQPGSDYTVTTGTLTFQPGESKKAFTVPVFKDTVSDPGETVNLMLSNPTGGALLGSQNTAALTIYE